MINELFQAFQEAVANDPYKDKRDIKLVLYPDGSGCIQGLRLIQKEGVANP